MLRKPLLPFLFLAFFANMAFAQTGGITGTVTNEDGQTVPTANVLLVEIGRGAATNLQGEYTIDNVEPGTYTLRVSFVGYTDYESQVTISADETLTKNVTLKQGAIGLDELVVTGYGVETEIESTGAVSSVELEDVEDIQVANAVSILQGRASGVQITSTSGTPGGGFNIEIRGINSINAGGDPLFVVDGVQLSFSNLNEGIDQSPLNFLDPDDIQSIQVLKDAASTAIYGAAGANGVVLITTKQGTAGQTQVSFAVTRGYREMAKELDLMNTDQWLEWWTRAAQYNHGGSRSDAMQWVADNFFTSRWGYTGTETFDDIRYTDWYELAQRKGITQSYDLTISGGDENTRYYVSGGYNDTQGQIRGSSFNRLGLSTSFSQQVSEDFSFNLNIDLGSWKQTGTCEDGFFINCPISLAIFELPITYPYLDNGEYNGAVRFGIGNNMELLINERERLSDAFQMVGSMTGTYDINDWLTVKSQFGLDYRTIRDRTYRNVIAEPVSQGTLNEGVSFLVNFNTNTTLNFRHTFDQDHNFNGLVGIEYRRDFTREVEASAEGFPGTLFDVLNAAATPTFASGYTDEYRKLGFFGRVRYNYDGRYFAQLTGRYDGSSRFGADTRFGFFPSLLVGWEIAEENFFNVDFVNRLKVTASYGVAGNSQIGLYSALGLFSISGTYLGGSAINPTQLANPLLTWEESQQFNFGLEFGMWNNRVSGKINLYQYNNDALLLDTSLPSTSSFSSITKNIGELRNRGIDFELETINIVTNDFQWSTTFKFSVFNNKILSLNEGIDRLNPNSLQPFEVGRSTGEYRAVRWAGVNPVDGRPMWYNADGTLTYTPVFEDDAVFQDGFSAAEDAVGGFGTTLSYKGLSATAFFQFSYGKHARPRTVFVFGNAQIASTTTNGVVRALTHSWHNPGDLKPIPSPDLGGSGYPGTFGYSRSSSNAFFDATYLRLKTMRVAYSLPVMVTDALNISNVQLFATGYNLVTWTSYPGYDPEEAGASGTSSIPQARSLNFGIDITF